METFSIFHSYTDHAITPEERHSKRVKLEPLIFDILKAKYSKSLLFSWKANRIPAAGTTPKTAVIVESRIHPNLQFLLHNLAYYCRGWHIAIVCSKENLEYCQIIAEHNKDVITFLPIFNPPGSGEIAKQSYNTLLKSAEFYSQLPGEYFLITQTDSYLKRHMPDTILQFDYVASPFSWEKEHQGGGISFRKKSAMLKICQESKRQIESEDVFISCSATDLGLKKPKWEEALKYFCESTLFAGTIGVHQWWTFLRHVPGTDQCRQVFHALLTLEL